MKFRQLLLAVLMLVAGFLHFIKTEFYLKIMPDFLPYPRFLVWVSGVAAMGIGVLLFWKRTQNLAARGAAAYFIAVFPANIYMAFHPEIFPSIPGWVAWARLPLQGVLIYWALCCVIIRPSSS